MKILYIGTDELQQGIAEALRHTPGNHEVLTAVSKEELVRTLERGNVDILLFDCTFLAGLSLSQAVLYARAFKAPVITLNSAADATPACDLQAEGISGYVFREHIGQLPFVIGSMVEKSELDHEKQELEQMLLRKNRFYQALLKNIDDFVFLFDEKGELVYLSPSANQLTGLSNLAGKQLFEYIHPDDRKKFFFQFKKILKKPDCRVEVHFRILHKSGHYIWIEGGVANLVKDDAVAAFVLSCRDVTERKETEQTLERVNRLYASIRQINRAILSVEDEQTLFEDVCYVATEFGNFRMAYISLVDPTTRKLKLAQSSGLAEEDVEPSMVVKNLEYAPLERVLQTGECFVCNNVQADLDAEYWKYVARQKRFGSFIALPICKPGRIVGVFVLAAAAIDAFTAKEIELLEETADDISFKLEVLEKEKARAGQGPRIMQHQVPNWA